MKTIAIAEEDPGHIRTGRTLKVPCSVLLLCSENVIQAEADKPCVENSRMSEEYADSVGQLVIVLKAWDRSLFVVRHHCEMFGMPYGFAEHLSEARVVLDTAGVRSYDGWLVGGQGHV